MIVLDRFFGGMRFGVSDCMVGDMNVCLSLKISMMVKIGMGENVFVIVILSSSVVVREVMNM